MFHYYKYIIRQKYEKIIKYTLSFKALYSSDTGNKPLNLKQYLWGKSLSNSKIISS